VIYTFVFITAYLLQTIWLNIHAMGLFPNLISDSVKPRGSKYIHCWEQSDPHLRDVGEDHCID